MYVDQTDVIERKLEIVNKLLLLSVVNKLVNS